MAACRVVPAPSVQPDSDRFDSFSEAIPAAGGGAGASADGGVVCDSSPLELP